MPPFSPAKDLYRRMDQLLGDLHARLTGPGFLAQALGALYDAHGRDLGITSAWLFAYDGPGLERVASVGGIENPAWLPPFRADFRDRAEPVGQRMRVVTDERIAAEPLASFEIAHPSRMFVFVFRFKPDFDRAAAELVLNTACSILSVRLTEERLGAAMREAAEIQQSLLPARAPDFPGFELAARSQPANEVGGDWFDYLPLGEGALGLSVGDASGHGLPAALMARDVVIGLRMGIERELKAGHALEKLNRVLHASTLSSCFASLLFGELEDNGSFFYYNAGHDAPLLVTEAGCTLLRTDGTVLGPLPEARFRRHFAHIDKGAVLALYTDGVVEQRSRAGELFGIERLQAQLHAHRAQPAAEQVQRVFEAIDHFGAGVGAQDDATLLIVRRLGGPAGT